MHYVYHDNLAEPPPVECDGKWTRYFDRDNPSGKGDYENLRLLLVEYPNQICEHPIAVDAKLVGSETHYPIPGLVATETPEEGFFCQNADQFGRTCLDFEVRFCCPEGIVRSQQIKILKLLKQTG